MLPETLRPQVENRPFSAAKAAAFVDQWGHILRGGRFPYPDGKRLWVNLEEWPWEWTGPEGRRWRLRVPKGWVTDLASIPWLVQPIVGGTDQLGVAGPFAHDVPYQFKGRLPGGWLEVLSKGGWFPSDRCIPRYEADVCLLRDTCLMDDVEPWRANLALFGVRANVLASWGWC